MFEDDRGWHLSADRAWTCHYCTILTLMFEDDRGWHLSGRNCGAADACRGARDRGAGYGACGG